MVPMKDILFQLKKFAPQILMGLGITSMVGGTVAGCIATSKLPEVKEEHEQAMRLAGDSKDQQRKIKRSTAGKVVKLYIPCAMLELFGTGCLLGSNGEMMRREAGWIAAYKTIDSAYQKLQKKVESGTYFEAVTDGDPEGEEAVSEGKRILVKPVEGYLGLGPYDEYFDCNCRLWSEDPDMTLTAIRNAMWDLNNRLQRENHLFLNDVRRRLGFSDIPIGQKVGWIYDANDPANHSNVIDFGIEDILSNPSHKFRKGQQEGFVLKIRPDGVIWDQI